MPVNARALTNRRKTKQTERATEMYSVSERCLLLTAILQTSGFPNGVEAKVVRIHASFDTKEYDRFIRGFTHKPSKRLSDLGGKRKLYVITPENVPNDWDSFKNRKIILTDHGLEVAMSMCPAMARKWVCLQGLLRIQESSQLHQKELFTPTYQPVSTPEIMARLDLWYINVDYFRKVLQYMYANPGYISLEELWGVAKADKPGFNFLEQSDTFLSTLTTQFCYICNINWEGKGRMLRLKVCCFAQQDHPRLPGEYGVEIDEFNSTRAAQRTAKEVAEDRQKEKYPLKPPVVFQIDRVHFLVDDLVELCGLGNVLFYDTPYPFQRGTAGSEGYTAFEALMIARSVLDGCVHRLNTGNQKRLRDGNLQSSLHEVFDFGIEQLGIYNSQCAIDGVDDPLKQILACELNLVKPSENCVFLLEFQSGGGDDGNQSHYLLWSPFLPLPGDYVYKGGLVFPVNGGFALHVRNYREHSLLAKYLPGRDTINHGLNLNRAYALYRSSPLVPPAFYTWQGQYSHTQLNTTSELVAELKQYCGNKYDLLTDQTFHCIENEETDNEDQEDDSLDIHWMDQYQTDPFCVLSIAHRALTNEISEEETAKPFSAHMSVGLALEQFNEIEATELAWRSGGPKYNLDQLMTGKVKNNDKYWLYLVGVSFIVAYDTNANGHLTNYTLTKSRKTLWFLWAPKTGGNGGIVFPDTKKKATKLDFSTNQTSFDLTVIKKLITQLINPSTVADRAWIERRIKCVAIYGLKPSGEEEE